ncbi:MAG: porin family protein, partial [Prevotella buccalis]|nr:porin family protein [Hoylesella buccalis]
MRQGLLSILLLVAAVQTQAQDDVEYRMEVGAGVGLVSYLGDFNGSVVKNMQPMGSLVWRWVLNPRMALRAKGSYGK